MTASHTVTIIKSDATAQSALIFLLLVVQEEDARYQVRHLTFKFHTSIMHPHLSENYNKWQP